MRVPENVTATWASSLADDQLLQAEARLHAEFAKQEKAEKKRAGDRYDMMRGPEPLMSAWLRWSMVSNETRNRGVVVRRAS